MTKTVGFLHTAQSNATLFEDLSQGAPFARRHIVRPDLLADAVAAGGLTDAIIEDTQEELERLAQEADLVLMGCSTLGPIADAMPPGDTPILRIDRALARATVQAGTSVVALCTVATTLEATRILFEEEAAKTGANVEVRLVDGAWDDFVAGDMNAYFAAIAAACDAITDPDTVIALAQASMTPAAALCRKSVPLTSPDQSLAAARSLIEGASPPP